MVRKEKKLNNKIPILLGNNKFLHVMGRNRDRYLSIIKAILIHIKHGLIYLFLFLILQGQSKKIKMREDYSVDSRLMGYNTNTSNESCTSSSWLRTRQFVLKTV